MRARDGDRDIVFDKSDSFIPFINPPLVKAMVEGERNDFPLKRCIKLPTPIREMHIYANKWIICYLFLEEFQFQLEHIELEPLGSFGDMLLLHAEP